MRNTIRVAAAVAGIVLLAYCIIYGWMVYSSPLAYDEMDFNHDGKVTHGEAGYASSFGTRVVAHQGRHCTEYFARKDGLPLRTVCHD